jgi:histone deacetylase complex regulatory component SIN3
MNSTDGGPPPSTDFNHAITYVTKVKTRCGPTTYTHFLDILHEYKADILSIRDVVESMSTLFVGQPDLLQEFAYFLPEATQWMLQTPNMLQNPSTVQPNAPNTNNDEAEAVSSVPTMPMAAPRRKEKTRPHKLTVEDALAYLAKVKTEFQDNDETYNMFLEIMKEFKSQHIDTTEVIQRVLQLFRHHELLLLDFNIFLPPNQQISPAQLDLFHGRPNTAAC